MQAVEQLMYLLTILNADISASKNKVVQTWCELQQPIHTGFCSNNHEENASGRIKMYWCTSLSTTKKENPWMYTVSQCSVSTEKDKQKTYLNLASKMNALVFTFKLGQPNEHHSVHITAWLTPNCSGLVTASRQRGTTLGHNTVGHVHLLFFFPPQKH